jgi:hypothetical protein
MMLVHRPAVTMRVLDLDGREVHSAVKGRRQARTLYKGGGNVRGKSGLPHTVLRRH